MLQAHWLICYLWSPYSEQLTLPFIYCSSVSLEEGSNVTATPPCLLRDMRLHVYLKWVPETVCDPLMYPGNL